MSIALMTRAWKSDIQSGQKMVLLALCDNANDQGECYPSISMVAKKCSMSERSVFNHVAELEKNGAIRRENRTGRSTIYHLDPCKFCTPANSAPLQILHPTPATVAPIPLQILHPTPANSAPITINEPSIEPSRKQKRSADAPPCPDDVDEQVYGDWLQLRKAKKAPVTETVLKTARKEAALADMPLMAFLEIWCARGSQGLEAAWLRNNDKRQTAESFSERDAKAKRKDWEEMTGRKWPESKPSIEF